MSSVASIPPMNGIDTSICIPKQLTTPSYDHHVESNTRNTHQDDIKRSVTLHPSLERLDSERTVLRNLHLMSVLLQNLDSKLLVDQVVFSDENVIRRIVLCNDGSDSVGLQRGDEG